GHNNLVNVGKLVSGGVHHVKIRVTLQDPGRSVNGGGRLPGRYGRQLRIERPGILELHEVHPVILPRRLDQLVDCFFPHILRVKLLQVVLWREPSCEFTPTESVPTEIRGASEDIHKSKVGLRKLESDGGVVHLLHGPRLAVDGHHGWLYWQQLVVLIKVLLPENEIIAVKRRA